MKIQPRKLTAVPARPAPAPAKGTLAERLKTLTASGVKPGDIFAQLHDLKVARGLRGTINRQLQTVKLGRPLSPAQAPHRGADGRMHAPNGDPLIQVKLKSSSFGTAETTSSRTAYVNPKTNQYYVVDSHGTIGPTVSRSYGPFSLPASSHFEQKHFSPWELRQLERAANGKGFGTLPIPRDPPIWHNPGFFPQLPIR